MPVRPPLSASPSRAVQVHARWVLLTFLALNVAVFLRYAIADWPQPWLHILGEQNTITWLSTIQLALIGWLAFAIALVMGIGERSLLARLQQVAWVGFGLAFLFLSADEALQIHEKILVRLAGLPAGEGLLMAVAVAGGGAACTLLLPSLLASAVSGRYFVSGCLLAVASQVVDIPDLPAMGFDAAWGKALEVSEEFLESAAEAAFIASLVVQFVVQTARQGVVRMPASRMAIGGQTRPGSVMAAAEAAAQTLFGPVRLAPIKVPPARRPPQPPSASHAPPAGPVPETVDQPAG